MISYIEEDDLLRFMIKEEVDLVLPLIEGADSGKITRQAFTDWVVTFLKHFSIYTLFLCPCVLCKLVYPFLTG